MNVFSFSIDVIDNPDVMVGNNREGIERVKAENGKYAFFMESSSIQYIIERECEVTQIGGTLDTKVFIIYRLISIIFIGFIKFNNKEIKIIPNCGDF